MHPARFLYVLSLPLLAVLTGCLGYQRGSLAHPELKTIAIGSIANPTNQPRVGFYLRQHLAEAITRDGTLRLVSTDKADCIIHATVADFDVKGIAESRVNSPDKDDRFNRTTAFSTDLNVSWNLSLPNATKPLLAQRNTVGRAVYTEQYDFDTAQNEGLRQATRDAAVQMVSEVTEGW